MSDKELAEMSEKDLEQLVKLLTTFYKKEWEESYGLFKRDIEKLILGRDTNPKYRSLLVDELADLVATVALRFSKINRKSLEDGRKIEHFYGLLNKMAEYVYREWLRRIRKPIDSLDDPSFTGEPSTSVGFDKELEDREERAIKLKCQMKCLASLKQSRLDLLLEYYGVLRLPPKERTAARVRLALRLANISPAEASPEQIEKKTSNLNKNVSVYRSTDLKPCMEKCLKREHSRSRRLF